MTDSSSIEHVDVLIVGTGPSGTSTALHMIRQDPSWAERITMVDKAVHPREKLCGGGVTHMGQHILARLGLPFEPAYYSVNEARLIYEDKSYSFYGDPVFRIVRREEFDHWLVKTTTKLGVDVREGEPATAIQPFDDYIEVSTTKSVYHAKVLVGADGSKSFVRRSLNWPDDSRVARLIEVLTPEDDRVQSEFRDGVAILDFTPMEEGLQGYYWDFPSYVNGEPFMNRGVFDSRIRTEKPKANLKTILNQEMVDRDRNLADYKLKGHPIRWFSKQGRFAIPRVILVGDAAGTDPLVGEGISFALGYGNVAEKAISWAFENRDFTFNNYPKFILNEPLFRQLHIRTQLAKYAYKLNKPWLARFGWRIAPFVVKQTRWGRSDFDPSLEPAFNLLDKIQAAGGSIS